MPSGWLTVRIAVGGSPDGPCIDWQYELVLPTMGWKWDPAMSAEAIKATSVGITHKSRAVKRPPGFIESMVTRPHIAKVRGRPRRRSGPRLTPIDTMCMVYCGGRVCGLAGPGRPFLPPG